MSNPTKGKIEDKIYFALMHSIIFGKSYRLENKTLVLPARLLPIGNKRREKEHKRHF